MSPPTQDRLAQDQPEVSGHTRVAGVIGAPVAHSLSPAIHNAAYRELGLDWTYVGLPVAEGDGHAAVAALATLGFAGANVTMPHKAAAADACDTLSPHAATLDAVNTVIVRNDGSLLGESTDGAGFLALLTGLGVDPAGRKVLVLGAGGAARAIVLALGRTGAQVAVAARHAEAAASAAALSEDGESFGWDNLDSRSEWADIVVNATPVGMAGEPGPIAPEAIRSSQVIIDTIYDPAETQLLASARSAGARTANGLAMLVGQAALAFELFTGHAAPVEVMTRAAEAGRGEQAV